MLPVTNTRRQYGEAKNRASTQRDTVVSRQTELGLAQWASRTGTGSLMKLPASNTCSHYWPLLRPWRDKRRPRSALAQTQCKRAFGSDHLPWDECHTFLFFFFFFFSEISRSVMDTRYIVSISSHQGGFIQSLEWNSLCLDYFS